MPQALEKPLTFSAFEGKAYGNVIKGVSLLQKGPALGHGVWIDDVTLSQAKNSAIAAGKIKAKQNHWSGIEDTIGYYENFRIRSGKLLADLTLFESHGAKDVMLEMIETIPTSFGVSIMFSAGEPEYSKDEDRYNARVNQLFSADFVDTPAANRDGVFEAGIDNNEKDMAQATTQPDAFDAKAEVTALQASVEKLAADLTAALEALKPKEQVALAEQPAPVTDETAALKADLREAITALNLQAAAPVGHQSAAPINDQEIPAAPISYAAARKEAIGSATGLDRIKAARAFDTQFANEAAYIASFKK